MKLVNLTPHEITIHGPDGCITLPVAGPAPRLGVERVNLGVVPCDYSGYSSLRDSYMECMMDIPIVRSMMGEPTGLPDPQEGVIFVVSALVAEHPFLANRTDLAYPGEAIRDTDGKIVGAQGLCAGPGLAGSLRA